MIRVTVDGKEYEVKEGATYGDVAKLVQDNYEYDIILAKAKNKLRELFSKVEDGQEISFFTVDDSVGRDCYNRSVTFLMITAADDILSDGTGQVVKILYGLSKGYYCELDPKYICDEAFIEKLKTRMREIVEADEPIVKSSLPTNEAIDFFREKRMVDKEKLFRYRQASKVNIYSLDNYSDYFYGYMASSTGILKTFDVHKYDKGFVLQFAFLNDPDKVADFRPENKLYEVLKESKKWSRLMGVDTVGALNDEITAGRGNDLVLIQEALQEKKIGDIAEQIVSNKDYKFVLVAGPSSSGKTSFTNRLSIQLRTHGIRPQLISVDNYFVDREKTPLDENGEYDFESIYALDLEQLNKDIKALVEGQEIDAPTYNFVKGRREYLGNKMKMGADDILLLESIHGLNDQLTYLLPAKNKFKIYISALTSLNIDEHNRIPTTDGRLLRRMARDARTRGISARETIRMWPSVKRGEEKNIFPYQETADVMFNSSQIYELAVLKQCCEPLLYGIPQDSPEYPEAKRLLKFMDYFLGFSSDYIPRNSIIREFVGGSCFNV